MIWFNWVLIPLAAVAAIWAGLALLGRRRWQAHTARLLSELAATRLPLADRRYDPAMLEGLPPPVQRYFRAVLTPGQPMVRGLRMTHDGSFNMGQAADAWKPFTSVQVVRTARPGFVWDASVRVAPGLPVRVHDAYVAGEGRLEPSILGLFPLVPQLRGSSDIAAGQLMRYLGEAALYPTALLPGQGVEWTAMDETSAQATLTDGAVSVSLTFHFGPDDLIVSARAAARGRMVGATVVATPWEGQWSGYARHDGMLVPMVGQVAWVLPERNRPYWRARVTSLTYDMAD
jgi:hypothetical protein